MGATASLLSCNSPVETALDMAGANQAEKEKVLEHFRDDPALLQYESASTKLRNIIFDGFLI